MRGQLPRPRRLLADEESDVCAVLDQRDARHQRRHHSLHVPHEVWRIARPTGNEEHDAFRDRYELFIF